MRVAMIGATGLIGRSVVPLLSNDHALHLLGRRSSGFAGRETVAEADRWPGLLATDQVEVAISTLGTTWNQAGSWPRFEAVDHHAVLGFARAARAAGARQFITISTVGADVGSRNRYLAIKGRVEEDLAALEFERLDIFRPGLLRGERGSDRRRGERFGILVSPLVNLVLRGPLDRFAAIDAATVAAALVATVGAEASAVVVHHNRAIRQLAG